MEMRSHLDGVADFSSNLTAKSVDANGNEEGLGFVGLSELISSKWKSLNAEKKLKYELAEKKDQQRYAQEIEEWQNRKFEVGEAENRSKNDPTAPANKCSDGHHEDLVLSEFNRTSLTPESAKHLTQTELEQLQHSEGNQERRACKPSKTRNSESLLSVNIPCAGDSDMEEYKTFRAPATFLIPERKHDLIATDSIPWAFHTIDRCGLEPTPLSPGSSLACSIRLDPPAPNLSKRNIYPESLSQLVSQLENDEIEFLASLRNVR